MVNEYHHLLPAPPLLLVLWLLLRCIPHYLKNIYSCMLLLLSRMVLSPTRLQQLAPIDLGWFITAPVLDSAWLICATHRGGAVQRTPRLHARRLFGYASWADRRERGVGSRSPTAYWIYFMFKKKHQQKTTKTNCLLCTINFVLVVVLSFRLHILI